SQRLRWVSSECGLRRRCALAEEHGEVKLEMPEERAAGQLAESQSGWWANVHRCLASLTALQ
ncbi:MAG: hypothetical protein ACERK1_11965, partial [Anaerolineales bacterium]